MMAAGTYDIATEHAILAEASTAGKWSAVPQVILFGIFLGLLYDVFRVAAMSMGLRHQDIIKGGLTARMLGCRCRSVKGTAVTEQMPAEKIRRVPAAVMQFMLDILYFLLCGVLGAVFLYWRNDGILRWYLLLCGMLGFWAYNHTAGLLVMRIMVFASGCVHALICTVFNCTVYFPLRWGYLALKKAAAMCRRFGCTVRQTKKKGTKQRKRIGAKWQNNRNNQRKNPVSSRKSRFSSSSASVPSRSFSFTGRLLNIRKKLP